MKSRTGCDSWLSESRERVVFTGSTSAGEPHSYSIRILIFLVPRSWRGIPSPEV